MTSLNPDGSIPDLYENFIAVSRYARWLDDEQRRETWAETVDRYIDFFRQHLSTNHGYDPDDEMFGLVREAIRNRDVMPSMRALMTAGPALERSNISSFNCSFTAVDHPRAFDEALFILMNGTGLGFSVEARHIDKLPVVPDTFEGGPTIVVEDSKEGWATAYQALLSNLWAGSLSDWDMSNVRPAGARLKTFGGRASGPGPLDALFRFTVATFKHAAGRRLTPIECHDIMCKIGEIVVVGGVRRSALISLSDLDNFAMAKAKSGNWWEDHAHRALSNNSAVYLAKPSPAQFLREWRNLIESNSGERGIVNLAGLRKHAARFGNRDVSLLEGLNPCLVGSSLLMTESGLVSFYDAYKSGQQNTLMVDSRVTYVPSDDGKEHAENWKIADLGRNSRAVSISASEVFLTQRDASVVKVSTHEGYEVTLTPDHLVATTSGMVPAGDLVDGSKILVTAGTLPNASIVGKEPESVEEMEAALMGLISGDGTFMSGTQHDLVCVDLWGDDRQHADRIGGWISHLHAHYGGIVKSDGNRPLVPFTRVDADAQDKVRFQSTFLAKLLADKYGFTKNTKHVVPARVLEHCRTSVGLFYVAGLFFADGTVNLYNKVGSSSVRLSSSTPELLRQVQLILLANGIESKRYLRRAEGASVLPDGRGGSREYATRANYELLLTTHKHEFATFVGFLGSTQKESRMREVGSLPSRKSSKFVATVTTVEAAGSEDVYCLKEPVRRILSADGITMRRCAEIILRNAGFCNLTEVVVRPEDTPDDVLDKIRLAAVIGTWQASLTDFPYLRDDWKKNAQEEALLGVSLTGIYGNRWFNNADDESLPKRLRLMREHARAINDAEAGKIGISPAAAITTVKPSGCRPAEAITVTDSGILTLDEIFMSNRHPDGEEWHPADLSTPSGRISKTYDNGKAPVFGVNLAYGVQLQSTGNHQWFTTNRGWVETLDLQAGDAIEVSKGVYSSTTEFEFLLLDERAISMRNDSAQQVQYPTHMTSDLAWLIGYLWGDGAQSPAKYRLRFSDERAENLEKVQRIMAESFGLTSTVHDVTASKALTLEYGNKYLWHWLIKQGVWKYFADDVDRIPESVRRSSKESVIAFFAGVLDSDGWVGVSSPGSDRSKAILTTASELFAKSLQDVSWAVGLCLSRSKNVKTGEGHLGSKPMYLLGSTGQAQYEAMELLGKHSVKGAAVVTWLSDATTKVPRHDVGRVLSVEPLGVMETFDVEVEGTHWYWDGAFKSHNTVSQLTGVSSGIHPWYAPHYVRTVRASNNDPLTKMMKDYGFPNEPDVMKPDTQTVFSFPIKAPRDAVFADDLSATRQLELWSIYREHYTEHNPSVTIYVGDDEWIKVGSWVYDNWDSVGGISFLPRGDGHVYQQAPYQAVTWEEYAERAEAMPDDVRWADLSLYELQDSTVGSQTLACATGESCEIVDLT